jgi:hypothetical protein
MSRWYAQCGQWRNGGRTGLILVARVATHAAYGKGFHVT